MIPTGLTQVTGLPALVSFWLVVLSPLLPDVGQSWHEVKHQVVAQGLAYLTSLFHKNLDVRKPGLGKKQLFILLVAQVTVQSTLGEYVMTPLICFHCFLWENRL